MKFFVAIHTAYEGYSFEFFDSFEEAINDYHVQCREFVKDRDFFPPKFGIQLAGDFSL